MLPIFKCQYLVEILRYGSNFLHVIITFIGLKITKVSRRSFIDFQGVALRPLISFILAFYFQQKLKTIQIFLFGMYSFSVKCMINFLATDNVSIEENILYEKTFVEVSWIHCSQQLFTFTILYCQAKPKPKAANPQLGADNYGESSLWGLVHNLLTTYSRLIYD